MIKKQLREAKSPTNNGTSKAQQPQSLPKKRAGLIKSVATKEPSLSSNKSQSYQQLIRQASARGTKIKLPTSASAKGIS